MVKTHNSHYNNTTSQNLNLEMDLWIAFKGETGKAFTAIKINKEQVGNYKNGVFTPVKIVEEEIKFSIFYTPSDKRNNIFHVVYECVNGIDSFVYNNQFETIQQAKRWITKCFGSGFKFIKHF